MIQFDHHLLHKDELYYLAYSGGVDSLSVAHFLTKGGYNIRLVHVNHKFVPEDTDIAIDAALGAKAIGLSTMIMHNPILYSGKQSPEAWCREVRYKLLGTLDAPVIVCHHLNDMAEGYLMNCIRGNPMRVPLTVTAYVHNTAIIRPFLRTKKEDFQQYCRHKELLKYIVPEVIPSERQHLRDKVIPHLQSDLTSVVKRLFIDTGLIYHGEMIIKE